MQTLNGFGTKLYGKSAIDPDGSYIATKWIVVLFFPIIPLGSYRVWTEKETIGMPNGAVMMTMNEKVETSFLGTKQRIKLLKAKWSWQQIWRTYLIGFILLVFTAIVVWLLSEI